MSTAGSIHGAGMAQYLSYEDYLLAAAKSFWMGEGAASLGQKGQVDGKVFRNLLKGFDPEGKTPLVGNTGPNRQSCWDVTFSVPKSVSVLWALSTQEVRAQIEKDLIETVKSVVAYFERELAQTRRGHAGERLEPVKVVVAAFLHGTSRAQDPQLHIHIIFVNSAERIMDKTWGTLVSRPLYENLKSLDAMAKMELATRLQKSLNVGIVRDGNTFEIEGVPQALCQLFSKRSQQIEESLRAKGLSSPQAAAIAALDTREPKHNLPSGELFASWRKTAEEFGWGRAEAQKLAGKVLTELTPNTRLYETPKRVAPEGRGRDDTSENLDRLTKEAPNEAVAKRGGDQPRRTPDASKEPSDRKLGWERSETEEQPGDDILRLNQSQLLRRLEGTPEAEEPEPDRERVRKLVTGLGELSGYRLTEQQYGILGRAYELKQELSAFQRPDPTNFVKEKTHRDELSSEWFRLVRDNRRLFTGGGPFEAMERLLSDHAPAPAANPGEDEPIHSRASHSRAMQETLAQALTAFPMRQIVAGRDLIQRAATEGGIPQRQ